MCRCSRSHAKSGAGVHSSVVELTRLAVQASHLVVSLINPNVVFAWLNFDIYLVMCDPSSVPLFLVGIMPSLMVAVVLRD